jgi:hypothetical protein
MHIAWSVIYPWHHSACVGWRSRMKGTKRHSCWIQFKNSKRHSQWQREMGNDESSFPIRGIISLCEYYKSRMVDLHSSLDFMFAKLAMDWHTNILWWKQRLRCSKQSLLALQIGVSTILEQMVILDKKKNPINAMHNKIDNWTIRRKHWKQEKSPNAKPEVQNLPEAESFQCVNQQQKQEAKLTAISTPNPNPYSKDCLTKFCQNPLLPLEGI